MISYSFGYIRLCGGDDKAMAREKEKKIKILDMWAKENGEVFVKIIVESCKVKDIKMLDRVLNMMDPGDIFVAANINQISNSPDRIRLFVELAENKGIRIVIVEGGLDTITPSGRLMMNILTAVTKIDEESGVDSEDEDSFSEELEGVNT
tara:strand:+ start:58377 stop:58826 length:450 start_codon:yes stop_codon:yes gene_type:complete